LSSLSASSLGDLYGQLGGFDFFLRRSAHFQEAVGVSEAGFGGGELEFFDLGVVAQLFQVALVFELQQTDVISLRDSWSRRPSS